MYKTFRASFYTLGCRLNQAETAMISQSFARKGYEVVDFAARSDVVVINTCTVTDQADSKCRQLVRQVLRRSPDATVAVVGCYAQMGTDALRRIEGIDLIVGTEEKMRLADFIDVPQKLPEPVVIAPRIRREAFTISSVGNYEHSTRANLKVQDGCDFMCSFCIIPFARGRGRSREFWDIQREAMELVERGHRELVLTGVNVGTYEYEGKTLLDVIRMLESVEGLERIRISSIEPTTIPLELLYHMRASPKLCHHLHIPLQSGDNAILSAMRRRYDVREYGDFLRRVLEIVPDLCLGTDVMVGFPGEGEREFELTRRLLEELPFAYVHVFTFSDRRGTPAHKMADHVDVHTKRRRSQALRRLSAQKRQTYARRQIGRTLRVLLEERNDEGLFQGFSDNYVKVGTRTDSDLTNTLVRVEVQEVHDQMALGPLSRAA